MSQCCFGVEPRNDGSIVVAAEEGEAFSIERFRPDQTAALVQFVRKKEHSSRVCIASAGGRALDIALAFGALPGAEVILLRPAALRERHDAANGGKEAGVALALARYARRAA